MGAAFLAFWMPVIIFLKLAGEVVEKEQIPFDVAILEAVHAQATTTWDAIFLAITTAGDVMSIIVVTIILSVYLYYKHRRRDMLLLVASVGGAAAANIILKLLFQRARPSLWHSSVVETTFSFPSGHAMLSSALIFSLVVILWKTRYRWAIVVVGALFVLLVGLSRLYFGVHYPSDIIAGWSASLAWVVIVSFVVAKSRNSATRKDDQKGHLH